MPLKLKDINKIGNRKMHESRTFQLGIGGIESINGAEINRASGEVAVVSGNDVHMLQGPQQSIEISAPESSISNNALAL